MFEDGVYLYRSIGAVYGHAGNENLRKDCWNPKRKIGGNHAYFRDN